MRCHRMGSARNRNGSFIILREWYDWMVEGKVQGVRCVWGKRRTWSYQSSRWFKISVRDHTHAQMAFIAIQWTLFCWRETTISSLRYCRLKLFVYDWLKISRGNLLDSCDEKQTFNKLFTGRAKGLTKTLTLKGKSAVIFSSARSVCLHSALPVQTL